VDLPQEIAAALPALREIAAAHGVRAVAIIGSVPRGTFDPKRSDIDLLVDLGGYTDDPGRRALSFRREAQLLFGRHVDVVSTHGVRNPTWRAIHAASQVPVYAAT